MDLMTALCMDVQRSMLCCCWCSVCSCCSVCSELQRVQLTAATLLHGVGEARQQVLHDGTYILPYQRPVMQRHAEVAPLGQQLLMASTQTKCRGDTEGFHPATSQQAPASSKPAGCCLPLIKPLTVAQECPGLSTGCKAHPLDQFFIKCSSVCSS